MEEKIARQIERALAAGDANAQSLRAEIAAVLEEIDAGGIALRAAIEDGSERVRSDVIAAIGKLGAGFGELGFLIKDVARQPPRSSGAWTSRVRMSGQSSTRTPGSQRRSAWPARTWRSIEWRTRGVLDDAARGNQGPRWVHGCPYRGLLPFGEGDAEVF